MPTQGSKFAVLTYGTSGHLAWSKFLEKSNLSILQYNEYFNIPKTTNWVLWIIGFHSEQTDHRHKILGMMPSDITIIVLTRDPISRIKSQINHGWPKDWDKWRNPVFTLKDYPVDVLDRFAFYDNYNFGDKDCKPVSSIPFFHGALIELLVVRRSFAYAADISCLPSFVQIQYYDIESIMPKNAFNTITNLAKEFDFDCPKEEERAFYEDIKWNPFSYILPLQCMLTLNNQERILHITTKYNRDSSLLEIKEYLFEESLKEIHILQSQEDLLDNTPLSFMDSMILLNDLSFSMEEKDFLALKNNESLYKEVKTYMKKFLIALKKRIDFINKHKKTENDILEYLSMDKELRNKLKTLLDRELAHIKEHRPDIVDSWKYYKEFERICEEEDCF